MMSPGSKGWEEKQASLDGRRGPCNTHFSSSLLRSLVVVLYFLFFVYCPNVQPCFTKYGPLANAINIPGSTGSDSQNAKYNRQVENLYVINCHHHPHGPSTLPVPPLNICGMSTTLAIARYCTHSRINHTCPSSRVYTLVMKIDLKSSHFTIL